MEVYTSFRLSSFNYEPNPRNLRYEALSYVWGLPTHDHEVITPQGKLRITANLAEALQQIRRPHESRNIWIDAVCINQEDQTEREQQVRMMSVIYSKAVGVLVWLGCPPDYKEAELHFEEIIDAERYKRPNPAAFGKVYDLEWFSRVWVIQEALLARDAIFIWGPFTAHRSSMLQEYRRMRPSSSGSVTHWFFFKSFSLRFLEMLQHTRSLHCIDPRDRVYALLGLQYDSFYPLAAAVRRLEPNYSLSIEEVFIQVACMAVQNHELPRLLSQCDRVTPESLSLPSWVPNWSRPSSTKPMSSHLDHPHTEFLANLKTGCFTRPLPVTNEMRKTLSVKGRLVDVVTAVMKRGLDRNTWFSVEDTIADFLSPKPDCTEWKFPLSSSWEHSRLRLDGSCIGKGFVSVVDRDLWHGRRIFETQCGHYSLGPEATQPGDLLVLLSGSELYRDPTLAILRKKNGSCTFIGNAHVPMFMNKIWSPHKHWEWTSYEHVAVRPDNLYSVDWMDEEFVLQ